jgi:small subunit ribosomal protein S2
MSLLDKYVRKKSSANNLTVKQLVDFRTHIGTKFSFRNPLIDEYIYGLNISKNIIFNSSISLFLLRRTLNFLEILKKDNGQVLFVGTNGDFSKLVKFAGESTGQPYVSMRWIKGLLTNWENLNVSIKFYNLFLKKLRKSRRQKQKMHENFYGLRFLNKLPSAIFLISLNTDKEIIHEAKRLNIPIIAIVDSNQPVDLIDYPLLANSESLISVFFLIRLITLSLQK